MTKLALHCKTQNAAENIFATAKQHSKNIFGHYNAQQNTLSPYHGAASKLQTQDGIAQTMCKQFSSATITVQQNASAYK